MGKEKELQESELKQKRARERAASEGARLHVATTRLEMSPTCSRRERESVCECRGQDGEIIGGPFQPSGYCDAKRQLRASHLSTKREACRESATVGTLSWL